MIQYTADGKVVRDFYMVISGQSTLLDALDHAHAAMRQALIDEDPLTVIRMALEKAGVET